MKKQPVDPKVLRHAFAYGFSYKQMQQIPQTPASNNGVVTKRDKYKEVVSNYLSTIYAPKKPWHQTPLDLFLDAVSATTLVTYFNQRDAEQAIKDAKAKEAAWYARDNNPMVRDNITMWDLDTAFDLSPDRHIPDRGDKLIPDDRKFDREELEVIIIVGELIEKVRERDHFMDDCADQWGGHYLRTQVVPYVADFVDKLWQKCEPIHYMVTLRQFASFVLTDQLDWHGFANSGEFESIHVSEKKTTNWRELCVNTIRAREAMRKGEVG